MKLVFKKNEEQEISVLMRNDEGTSEFNYVDMIKSLIDVKKLEEPEMEGDFSDIENESIHSMIKHINDEVGNFYEEDEE